MLYVASRDSIFIRLKNRESSLFARLSFELNYLNEVDLESKVKIQFIF